MADLQDTWICAQDLQLIRADRIVSLLVPVSSGYGAASPGDLRLHRAVYAEIDGGTEGDTLTRVKLADCGKTPAGELLANLASTLGSVDRTEPSPEGRCMFIFVDHDPSGHSRWVTARHLPEAWPQSTPAAGESSALTRSPLAD